MWDFMTIELQILQFALDKQKATYEHKRIYSKLNSLFSYFLMKTHISTEAIKMIMSRGEQLSWHQLNSMYVLRRNTTSLFFLQIACFYFMPKWIYQCCKKLTRFRVYLPRKYNISPATESPPHAEGPWLTTRLVQTDPFSVPLQTICNTRLYIVSIFSLNFTKTNPRVCNQSCMDVKETHHAV